ncbi:MAG TPA: efflux RND transporter periplasmic adaptor subunit [Rhizomicrobium sp.]|nr:efflux RND transporter periplasmic adaptor subunit [Rhizomicrobium sp.]
MTMTDTTLTDTKPAAEPRNKERPSPRARMADASTRGLGAVRRHPFISAALALLIAAGGWYLHALNAADESALLTVKAARGDIENSVTALGNIQPLEFVDVGAQATGQLKTLTVDIGSNVTKGQLLAEIDPLIAKAKVDVDQGNLANLQAQLQDKQAQAALATANLERQRRLLAANATSASEFDAANQSAKSSIAGIASLRAQISASQSQLRGDLTTLGYTKIDAPMSGTVVSVLIKQGQTINSVQQAPIILRIANLDTMQVQTQVSEADVPKLKVGMAAYFTTLGNPGRKWRGTLTQIQPTPTVTNNVVLYTATFNVANPDHALMTQMTTQVFFIIDSAKNVITVPVAALRGGRGKPWTPGMKQASVRVIGTNGKPEHRKVTVGVSNRVSAEITSGLTAGETVVAGRKAQAAGSSSTPRRPGGPRMGRI